MWADCAKNNTLSEKKQLFKHHYLLLTMTQLYNINDYNVVHKICIVNRYILQTKNCELRCY